MRESDIYVIIVTTKLNGKAISKHMKGQFMRVSSVHVINLTTKLHKKAASKHIECHYMKVIKNTNHF